MISIYDNVFVTILDILLFEYFYLNSFLFPEYDIPM